MMVGYIEALPMASVDLGPAIVVVLVVAIFAWCAWGLRALFLAVAEDELMMWPI